MTWFRRTFAAVLAVVLLATGCGSSNDDSSVTTIGLLSAALANTAEAGSYRESASVGTTMKLGGIELSSELDESNPIMVGEVSPERDYFKLDLSTLFEGFYGGALPFPDDIVMEFWSDSERLVIDTSSFQQLSYMWHEADLGPFPMPIGVCFEDLTASDADSAELREELAGTSSPDLAQMAVSLPAALITIEQTSTDPVTFVGTTTTARLDDALGWDTEEEARSDAETWVEYHRDVDELAEIFLQVYETNPVEVVIELDELGLLSVLWTKEDWSTYTHALVESDGFGANLSDEERGETAEVFSSFELIAEFRFDYEPDVNLEVRLPPSTDNECPEDWEESLTEDSA